MYCPRCGHQSISDAMRFCSYCGFKLGVVKAALADDDDVSKMDHLTIQELPKERQRDINIGVILMFVGSLLAGYLAGRSFGREGGAVILAAVFSSILLLSRPILKFIYKLFSWEEPQARSFSVSQKRMMFGSILMFSSTILVAIGSLLMLGRMRTPEFFLGLLIAFVVLLVISKYLTKALRYLIESDADAAVVSRTEKAHDPASVVAAASSPALTPGQDMPVSLFTSQRVTTAEILSPASVTEQTTNLLENK